jgi:carbon starvation protein
VSSLILGAILLFWLVGGYFIYGRFIQRRLVQPKDTLTPAHEQNDGVDYSPARRSLLFGHHFSSIAGAGPIVGPLIGVLFFGWLFAAIWIAIGSVFAGAVHDYLVLMASVRNQGNSIADVAEAHLGRRAKLVFSIFLWLTLVLVIAVFGDVTSATLVKQPEIVIPTFGLIFIAVLFGWAVYRKGLPVWLGTLLALGGLAGFLWLGERFPLAMPETLWGMPAIKVWFWVLMLYCLVASVLPVWLLLQPRDYLSMWVLFLGLGLGFLGVVAAHPEIQAPAFISFSTSKGPIWPMMFVIIACGAISGFHSLVSGGTSSKQLDSEKQGLSIGYGAMITEAILAVLVVIIAAAALSWDPDKQDAVLGFQYLMDKDKGGGPIVAFATGFGRLVDALPVLTATAGVYFGMLMLNAFVITTLDTSTRLARFIVAEVGGKKVPALANRFVGTILTVLAAAALGATGGYKLIWPIFGATNQLVAALALIVVSAWLVGVGKPRKYTLIPALFMLVTTVGALIYQAYDFLLVKGETWQNYLLGGLALLLCCLAAFIALEARQVLGSTGKQPAH